MSCWLFKTESGCFSVDDLANSPGQTTMWDGVRNFQARNFMRDAMRVGDPGFFYHSGKDPAIVALVEVASKAYPDPTQWDPEDRHFDPRSKADNPLWYLVDVRLVQRFAHPLPLGLLRTQPELEGMELLRKGSRLSVQPVNPAHYEAIVALAKSLG